MTPRPPDITVVIVSYKVRELLLKCLETLYRHAPEGASLQTIVVDNDSRDGSVEAVARRFPQAELVVNGCNAGFPAANNQAFRLARGRYVFMLNPDTELVDDSLARMLAALERDPSVGLIAPMQTDPDGRRHRTVWRFPTVWSAFCEAHHMSPLLGRKHYADKAPGEAFEADSCSGAALMFRAELLRAIGGLDESMYWIEDVDFCRRAREAGTKLLYYPAARVIHHVGQSAKKNYRVSVSNQVFNKVKFFRKHHPGIRAALVAAIALYHVTLKVLVFGALSPFKPVWRLKAEAYRYTWPKTLHPPVA